MRENLVGSAMLIPIIAQNRQAAETRMMKISNGMLVVIPRLMAVASQAAVQVDIRRGADEAEKLDEAARQITLLASKGAHDAATSAARSLGGDQRNIDVLAQVADEAIRTMHEVIDIEREVASGDREREAKLDRDPRPPGDGDAGRQPPRGRAVSGELDFDTQAAWLRRFTADAESNLRAFALRLREAMPDLVTVHESKGLFAALGQGHRRRDRAGRQPLPARPGRQPPEGQRRPGGPRHRAQHPRAGPGGVVRPPVGRDQEGQRPRPRLSQSLSGFMLHRAGNADEPVRPLQGPQRRDPGRAGGQPATPGRHRGQPARQPRARRHARTAGGRPRRAPAVDRDADPGGADDRALPRAAAGRVRVRHVLAALRLVLDRRATARAGTPPCAGCARKPRRPAPMRCWT